MPVQVTKEQLNFIKSQEPRLFLNAPAGCGKTFTLYQKLREFIHRNPNKRVLVLVFNVHMKYELEKRFKGLANLQIYTIHGFLYQLLLEDRPNEQVILVDESVYPKLKSPPKNTTVLTYPMLEEHIRSNFEKYKRYIEEYQLIVVDEFQDVNPNMLKIFELILRDLNPNFWAAGDLMQSIYSFQGVNIHKITQFLKDNNFIEYKLTVNFRSSSNIIELINAIFDLQLQSVSDTQGINLAIQYPNKKLFLNKIAYLVKHLLIETNNNFVPKTSLDKTLSDFITDSSELVFLVRNKNEIKSITQYLDKYNVPYLNINALNTLINKIISYFEKLALYLNPKLPRLTAEEEEIIKQADPQVYALINKQEEAHNVINQLGGLYQLQHRLKALKQDILLKRHDHIKIGTIHSSKGLEFDSVIIPFLNKGEFPPVYATDTEEEKRLLYVAISRAKRNILLASQTGKESLLWNAVAKANVQTFLLESPKKPKQLTLGF